MVSNDQAQAKLFGEGSLADRGDAAIYSQQQLRLSRQPAHSLLIDAVSLRVAVRNIYNCFQACRLQRFPGNHAGADAIHVIIAVNNRPGAPRAQLFDQGYGFPHAEKQQRIMQRVKAGAQKSLGILRVIDPPGIEQTGQPGLIARNYKVFAAADKLTHHISFNRWINKGRRRL